MSTLSQRKRAHKGFDSLSKWASGGSRGLPSLEEETAKAKANGIIRHRESVSWYLRRHLEECGEFQRSMMEIRLTREVEKSKSILYKTRGSTDLSGKAPPAEGDGPELHTSGVISSSLNTYKGSTAALADETERKQIEEQLSPEQLQLFARENQDLLKHFEDTLDQVRYCHP